MTFKKYMGNAAISSTKALSHSADVLEYSC